jgi:phage shock protein E
MRVLLLLVLAACNGAASPTPESRHEVVSSGPVTPTVNRQVARISVQDLKARMDAGETIRLVDVRTEREMATGMILGAVPMPLEDYTPTAPPVSTTPKDEPIFFVCESGRRSLTAAMGTAQAGYTVVNVEGGTAAWRDAGFPLHVPTAPQGHEEAH